MKKKLVELRALQTLKGNDAVIAEILKALKKNGGNMSKVIESLDIGRTSMYRLIADVGAQPAIDALVRELGAPVQGKVLSDRAPRIRVAVPKAPRVRVKKAKS